MYLKVNGNPDLVRDKNTHAIINTNSVEYESYLLNRQRIENQNEQLTKNTLDINNIKQDIDEIKQMLLLLLKKDNN